MISLSQTKELLEIFGKVFRKGTRCSSIWDRLVIEKGTWTLTVTLCSRHLSEGEHVVELGLDFRAGEAGWGEKESGR
jgi:hypothetical protein